MDNKEINKKVELGLEQLDNLKAKYNEKELFKELKEELMWIEDLEKNEQTVALIEILCNIHYSIRDKNFNNLEVDKNKLNFKKEFFGLIINSFGAKNLKEMTELRKKNYVNEDLPSYYTKKQILKERRYIRIVNLLTFLELYLWTE